MLPKLTSPLNLRKGAVANLRSKVPQFVKFCKNEVSWNNIGTGGVTLGGGPLFRLAAQIVQILLRAPQRSLLSGGSGGSTNCQIIADLSLYHLFQRALFIVFEWIFGTYCSFNFLYSEVFLWSNAMLWWQVMAWAIRYKGHRKNLYFLRCELE